MKTFSQGDSHRLSLIRQGSYSAFPVILPEWEHAGNDIRQEIQFRGWCFGNRSKLSGLLHPERHDAHPEPTPAPLISTVADWNPYEVLPLPEANHNRNSILKNDTPHERQPLNVYVSQSPQEILWHLLIVPG